MFDGCRGKLRQREVRLECTMEMIGDRSCNLPAQMNFTGSQWSSFNSGVIWSRFRLVNESFLAF